MKIIPYLALWLLIFPRASAVDFENDVKVVETGTTNDGKGKPVLDLFA
jgi:hypothetical protein